MFARPQSAPTFTQKAFAFLRENWINLRDATGQTLQRVFALVLFTLTNLGLPIGDLVSKTDNHSRPGLVAGSSGCKCSLQARQAGRCCCAKRSVATSCCTRKSMTVEAKTGRSCCAKGHQTSQSKSIPRDFADSTDTCPTWTDGCPCGSADFPLLICAQPRILPNATAVGDASDLNCRCIIVADAPCGQRPSPCVPPPEQSLV